MKGAIISCIKAIMFRRLTFLLLTAAPLSFAAEPVKCPPFPSRIDVESGAYSSQPGVTFKLREFAADMVSRGKISPLCFLRVAVVEHGEVFVSSESLSHIFERKLKEGNSNVSDVKLETGEGTARLTGKVKKLVPIPFTIEGPVSTDGTVINLEAKTIKAVGIPVKGLLEMVGAHLSSLMSSGNLNGVKTTGNKISFVPEQLGHIKGHIDQAVASPHGLTLKYRDTRKEKKEGAASSPSN